VVSSDIISNSLRALRLDGNRALTGNIQGASKKVSCCSAIDISKARQ